MALLNSTGKTPTGVTVPIPVSGLAASTTTPLPANGIWETPIMAYNGNEGVHFSIQSDQIGVYTVEYYKDGQKISFTGNPTTFDPSVVPSFQGALSGKGDSFKIKYQNGSVAQTSFYMEVKFGDNIQPTMRSVGIPISSTNMAVASHSVIEGRENATGAYKQATVTSNGSKVAQDVNVMNFNTGTQTVQIVDGNNQSRGIDANPLKVQYPAGYVLPITFPTTQQVSVSNFPATQPISGNVGITGTPTVNIGTAPEIEIKNDSANPIPVTIQFPDANGILGTVQRLGNKLYAAPPLNTVFKNVLMITPETVANSILHGYQVRSTVTPITYLHFYNGTTTTGTPFYTVIVPATGLLSDNGVDLLFPSGSITIAPSSSATGYTALATGLFVQVLTRSI